MKDSLPKEEDSLPKEEDSLPKEEDFLQMEEDSRPRAEYASRFSIRRPTRAQERELDDRLMAFNLQNAPPTQKEPFVKICRCALDPQGNLAGGVLAASVLWNVLHIETVWVDETYRGRKLATRLMDQVEGQAKREGCRMAVLNTYDFQAKGFYEKRGYRVFGELEGAARGHVQYYLWKPL